MVEAAPSFVVLRWGSPEKDGGCPLQGYNVEKKDMSRADFLYVATLEADVKKYKVTRLFENTDYLFRVFAENAVGVGEPATLDKPVTAKLPFSEFSDSVHHSIRNSTNTF